MSISILGRLHELASFVSRPAAPKLGLHIVFDWLLVLRSVNAATQLLGCLSQEVVAPARASSTIHHRLCLSDVGLSIQRCSYQASLGLRRVWNVSEVPTKNCHALYVCVQALTINTAKQMQHVDVQSEAVLWTSSQRVHRRA